MRARFLPAMNFSNNMLRVFTICACVSRGYVIGVGVIYIMSICILL